jgi:hypothetical protein
MSPCLCGDPHCSSCFPGHECVKCPKCGEECADECDCLSDKQLDALKRKNAAAKARLLRPIERQMYRAWKAEQGNVTQRAVRKIIGGRR